MQVLQIKKMILKKQKIKMNKQQKKQKKKKM